MTVSKAGTWLFLGMLLTLGAFWFSRPGAPDKPRAETRGASAVDVSQVVTRARPAVVTVEVVEEDPRTGPGSSPHPAIPEKMRKAEGSGFFYRKDGYLLTNNHVVGNAEKIIVTLSNGRRFWARVVASEPLWDIAVLRVRSKRRFPILSLGDSRHIKLGEVVVAIGNPLGLRENVTSGIISARARRLPDLPLVDFIQTDATLYPGSSGGPLLDKNSRVIGINAAIVPGTQWGLAIPANPVKKLIGRLEKGREIKRGSLGVYAVDVAEVADSTLTSGVFVDAVNPEGPTSSSLKQGDIVVAVDGRRTRNIREFAKQQLGKAPGARLRLTVRRGAEEITVGVRMGEPSDGIRQ